MGKGASGSESSCISGCRRRQSLIEMPGRHSAFLPIWKPTNGLATFTCLPVLLRHMRPMHSPFCPSRPSRWL
eukprot:6176926-Pleurochrysis_carterae.AAC.3